MSLLILSICNISMFINVLGAKITSTIRNKKKRHKYSKRPREPFRTTIWKTHQV